MLKNKWQVLIGNTAVCICSQFANMQGVASEDSTRALLVVEELEDAVQKYNERYGRKPPLDGEATWVYHLLWGGQDAPFLTTVRYRYASESDPTLETQPRDVVALDPWGNKIVCKYHENRILIYSMGLDGLEDGGMRDDISNVWGVRWWYYAGKHTSANLLVVVCLIVVVTVCMCVIVRKRLT